MRRGELWNEPKRHRREAERRCLVVSKMAPRSAFEQQVLSTCKCICNQRHCAGCYFVSVASKKRKRSRLHTFNAAIDRSGIQCTNFNYIINTLHGFVQTRVIDFVRPEAVIVCVLRVNLFLKGLFCLWKKYYKRNDSAPILNKDNGVVGTLTWP